MIVFAIISYIIVLLTIFYLNRTIQKANLTIELKGSLYIGIFILVFFSVLWISIYALL